MPHVREKKQLRFESLEYRALLAGNVLVNVVEGNLMVDGDDQANVLRIQQLPSASRQALEDGLRFRITPDENTSINRNDPGMGIVVAGVTKKRRCGTERWRRQVNRNGRGRSSGQRSRDRHR